MLISNESESLRQLCKIRCEWVDANRRNNFEDGIRRLLSEMYPDRAHFIYELLQNAEDAEASVVNFELRQESLTVTHNGKRLFNHKDVDSITSIGVSTKSDDVNQIGTFGVGFKAVFAYTNTPIIYSGTYNFEIKDLVCPFEIEPIEKNDDDTVFIFPFNNSEKKASVCFKEVMLVLQKINFNILLFLNHIKEINWSIDESRNGIVTRTHQDDIDPSLFRISISTSAGENIKRDAWFLCFQKNIPQHDVLKCGVALKLEFRNTMQTKFDKGAILSEQMKVVPDSGRLCIFFPADKEMTNLKFHINGPYKSTIDRASIRHDDPENISIFSHTTELFEDILEELKTNGLLTCDFLDVLPNDKDTLSPFYDKFRKSIYETLKNRNLIPTKGGGFAKASESLAGPETLSDFFSDDDVAFLSGKDNRQWAINVIQHFRAANLLESLGIPDWPYEDFVEAIEDKFSAFGSNDEANNWLIGKGSDWIREFYSVLWIVNMDRKPGVLGLLNIVLTENEQLVTGDEAYFPPDEDSADYAFTIVKKALLENISPDKSARLRAFLSATGVKEIGEREKIENILRKYYGAESSNPSLEQHERHINRFISWSQQNGDYSLFRSYYIFLDPEKMFHIADKLFLDYPFTKTGLSALQDFTHQLPLWRDYKLIKGFEDFAMRAGVSSELEIKKTSIPSNHPNNVMLHEYCRSQLTYNKIDEDYQIQNIEKCLKSPTNEISQLVWSTMRRASKSVLEARFRPNRKYPTKSAPSSLVYHLMKFTWIPAKDGNFYAPKKMTRNDLLDDFPYDNRNGWLTAIGFEEDEQQATEEYKAKQQQAVEEYRAKQRNARELGITIEDVDFITENYDDFQKIKEKIISQKTSSAFPTKKANDPERRKRKVAEKLKKAQEKSYEQKNRSVRTSRNNIDPEAWLRSQYTNDSGQMFCQLCQEELGNVSFKKRNGEDYFESIEIFKNGKISVEHEAQFLALCPLCAGKYKEFIKYNDEAAEKLFNALKEPANLEIPLQFGEESSTLRFVETHYDDLLVVLFEEPEEHQIPEVKGDMKWNRTK